MSTTARIYFGSDYGLHGELAERDFKARHRPAAASLFVGADGYPRSPRGHGVLDRLEAMIADAPARILCAATELAAHFIVTDAARDRLLPLEDRGYTVVPSNPTVGAIISYEYLVICHFDREPPTIMVMDGCLWWREDEFMQRKKDDEDAWRLLLKSKSGNAEGS